MSRWAPQVLGDGDQGPLGQTALLSWTDHPVLLAALHSLHPMASSLMVLEKCSNSLCKTSLLVGTTAGWMLCCQALRSNLQRQKQHLSSISQILLMQVSGPGKERGC